MIVYGKPASKKDWSALREICGRTSDSVPQERWDFFGEYWIGPYQRLLPDWAYTASSGGEIVGYLTGCPATLPFALRRGLRHRLPLLARVLQGRYPGSPEAKTFVKRALGLQSDPALRLSLKIAGGIMTVYPAHLHVNVVKEFQGQGIGRRLMEIFFKDLYERRIPGAHLVCGVGPLGFYKRLGFSELGRARSSKGTTIYALGILLA